MCVVSAGALVAQGPARAAVSSCPIYGGVHLGYHICEYPETIITWPDGHNQLFVVGSDWQVYSSHQEYPGDEVWSPWYPLGGRAHSSVWVTDLTDASISIHVIGTDRRAHVMRWDLDDGWLGWQPENQIPIRQVKAGSNVGWRLYPYDETTVEWPDGRSQKLVVGTDWQIYTSIELWSDEVWTAWQPLGGVGQSHVWWVWGAGNDTIWVYVIGTDEHVWGKWWNRNGSQGPWLRF